MKKLTFSLFALVLIFSSTCPAVTISEISPAHSRPFLLPDAQREALLNQVKNQDRAEAELLRLKKLARGGDGYSAALVYALLEEQEFLAIARNWLLQIGQNGGDLGPARQNIDKEFFNQGMPWLGDVFYKTDTRHLQAYDLVYKGLTGAERTSIEQGLLASALFRKNAMDTWWQTPNLVFKPTTMVAITGLVTQNRELIEWGFFRKPGSSLGGYFPALENMLTDNGPWKEAPAYAINHLPLAMSLEVSDFLTRMTGQDWYRRPLEGGSSVQGLMQYYIDTTYPREMRADGSRAYRLLTYGDGATHPGGDLFLLNRDPRQRDLTRELALAWKISRDPGYAALINLQGAYQPALPDRPPLPRSPLLPAAKSSIWPDFGLAFLRSDQTPGYWNNPKAMAASLLFRQGYGHGHADALSITFFGAGRLFYPDYNPVQYQNPAEGWTSSSVAHNTVVVDQIDSVRPESVRTSHSFGSGHSFIQAVVEEPGGLRKRRTLALTGEYLLDVFHLDSLVRKTFDYLLHSFARIVPDECAGFADSAPFGSRYRRIRDFRATETDHEWRIDFSYAEDAQSRRSAVIAENTDTEKPFPANRTPDTENQAGAAESASILRMEMAPGGATKIGYGVDPYGLDFLVARRENKKYTTFISTHTPFPEGETSPVHQTRVLVDKASGSLVKVMTGRFTDLHAIGHGEQKVQLTVPGNDMAVEFTGYAFLRIDNQTGAATRKGNWTGYRIPASVLGLEQDLVHGGLVTAMDARDSTGPPPLQVNSYPDLAVLTNFSTTGIVLTLTNLSERPLTAAVTLEESPDFSLPVREYRFDSIPGFQSATREITLGRYKKSRGIDILPLRITAKGYETPVLHGIPVSTGPGMIQYYEAEEPVYRVISFSTEFDIGMRAGFVKRIATSKGKELYSGPGLFGVADETQVFSPANGNIDTSYTWPDERQASVIAEINNRVRWQTLFVQDRAYIRMDPAYTRSGKVGFVFDKQDSAINWAQARYLRAGHAEPLPDADTPQILTRAFELPFGDSGYSLCIRTASERNWSNNPQSLELPLARSDDEWEYGVCESGSLKIRTSP